MSSAPPLSVILINRNGGSRLGPVLASLREQRFVELELIAIDCGSTDDSRAVLEAERPRLAAFNIVDGASTYAAANRGIAAAQGHWVLLLGSRDRLVGDMVLSECLNWMKKTDAGVVAGESADDYGRIQKLHSNVNAVAGDFLPRSATFYRRGLFAENGEFDESLGAMAGYEFHVRLWKSRIRFKPIPLRVAACESHPVYDRAACRAEIRTRHRYFSFGRCLPWDVVSVMRALKPQGGRRRGAAEANLP